MNKGFWFIVLLLCGLHMRSYGDLKSRPIYANRESEIRSLLAKYQLDPEWIRVAKLEAGTNLDSHVSREALNFFGLHRAYARITTAKGGYLFYACYNSADDCVRDILYWAAMSPRKEGESFDRWLKRRGWNHLPTYYRTLAQVNM